MKKVIGITGSIGSGKTYAVEIFKSIFEKNKIEAIFLNVDEIRRKILEKENINRDELNRKIYNDSKEMDKYKEFINPKIKQYLIEQINNAKGLIFIEWALLIEDGFYDIVDCIIMIYCENDMQIKRLEKGDLGKKEIIKRIDLQLTNEEKIDEIKKLNKEFYILNTTNNPELIEYENILKKGKLYE